MQEGVVMDDEYQRILRNLVRVGVVSSVDVDAVAVRIYFEDIDIVSDWLPVLQRGGNNWIPSVNDMVLCLYMPMFNADGFVLGEIP
jgi:phage baseplate assembly protein gpV